MVISSRTPEGEPAHCPVCSGAVLIEPSLFYSDAPCPACGSLLWFLRLGDQNVLVEPSEKLRSQGLISALAELTGFSEEELRDDPELLDDADLDSLDLVELVTKLEGDRFD